METLKRYSLPIRLAVLFALLVYLVLASRDTWDQISWEFFRRSPLLAMSLVAIICNAVFPAWKYHRLYHRCGAPITYRTALILELTTASLSLLMPGKTENVVRAAVLKSRFGMSWRHGLWVTVYHLYTTLIALLATLTVWAGVLKVCSPAASLALAVAILTCSWAPIWFGRRVSWAGLDLFARFRVGDHAIAILFSFVLIASMPLFILLAFAAQGIEAAPADVVFRSLLLDFLSQLPVSIGGIGVRESGTLWLFRNLAPASVLVATGFLTTLFEKLFTAVLGLPFVMGVLRIAKTEKQPDSARDERPVSA